MEYKTDRKNIKLAVLNKEIDKILGRRTQFEVTLKLIESLFDYINGIRQAANITNNQLSQKAQNALQYIQSLDQIIQQIKALKQSVDNEIDLIESEPNPQEDPIVINQPVEQNSEVIT